MEKFGHLYIVTSLKYLIMLLKCNFCSFLHHITYTDSKYGNAALIFKVELLLNNAFISAVFLPCRI